MADSNDDVGKAEAKEQDEAGDEERTTRHTERPVAHSVKPPPPAPSTKRGYVWVAMLGMFGVVGFMLREPPREASTVLAARAPSEPESRPLLEVAPPAAAAVEVNAPSAPATEQSKTAAPRAPAEPAVVVATKGTRDSAPSPAHAPGAAPKLAARALPEAALVAPSAAPAPPAPFNHKAANVTLDQSAKAASTCRRGTDPSGVARAVVSFAPTGRVTAAVISGPPFAGTETGSCIARTLRQAVIPAFSGEITTVAKTVEVQ